MLPNIKTQSAVLRKSLQTEFGIELKAHKAQELLARMMGFSDFQAMLRGVEKLSLRVFEGKVLHVVSSAFYYGGEDEISYYLGQILNLRHRNYFVVDARAELSTLDTSKQRSEIVPSGKFFQAEGAGGLTGASSPCDRWRNSGPYLISASDIYPEVLLLDIRNGDDERSSREALCRYVESKPFEAGIVCAGEAGRWKLLSEMSACSDFTPVTHIAISRTYKTYEWLNCIEKLIDEIRSTSPSIPILAWIFEDDCAVDRDRKSLVFNVANDHPSWFIKDKKEIPGLGFVEDKDAGFFNSIFAKLNEHGIPFIRVPHYSGASCFNSPKTTLNQVAERDRITIEILNQMTAIGLLK